MAIPAVIQRFSLPFSAYAASCNANNQKKARGTSGVGITPKIRPKKLQLMMVVAMRFFFVFKFQARPSDSDIGIAIIDRSSDGSLINPGELVFWLSDNSQAIAGG